MAHQHLQSCDAKGMLEERWRTHYLLSWLYSHKKCPREAVTALFHARECVAQMRQSSAGPCVRAEVFEWAALLAAEFDFHGEASELLNSGLDAQRRCSGEEDDETLEALVDSLVQLGRHEESLRIHERLGSPTHAWRRFQLGRSLLATGRHDQAIVELQALVGQVRPDWDAEIRQLVSAARQAQAMAKGRK